MFIDFVAQKPEFELVARRPELVAWSLEFVARSLELVAWSASSPSLARFAANG